MQTGSDHEADMPLQRGISAAQAPRCAPETLYAPPRVPGTTVGFRFTPSQRDRLARLARILDVSQTQAVQAAVVHMLATVELRERVHATVPSEHRSAGAGEAPEAQ